MKPIQKTNNDFVFFCSNLWSCFFFLRLLLLLLFALNSRMNIYLFFLCQTIDIYNKGLFVILHLISLDYLQSINVLLILFLCFVFEHFTIYLNAHTQFVNFNINTYFPFLYFGFRPFLFFFFFQYIKQEVWIVICFVLV